MFPYPRISSFLGLLALGMAFSGCGNHLSERLPSSGSAKGAGREGVSRDLAQSVELAIQNGESAMLKDFLDSGFPVNQPLNTGYTPLQQAIVSTKPTRFEAVFQVLMAKGADPLLRDHKGNAAVDLAKSKRVASRLLEPERNRETLKQLFAALEIEEDRARIVAFFTDEGEDVNVIEPESGHTPVTLAISLKRRKLFAPLIEELATDVNVNQRNGKGKTPLAVAKEEGWDLAIAKLTELGAKEE